MKRIALSCCIVASLLAFTPAIKAQTMLGLRLGGTSGITGKYFFKPDMAGEGIIGFFGNGFSLTGLIEKNIPVYNAPGLNFYYGGGGHVAFYNGRDRYYGNFGRDINYRAGNDVGFGINGIVGFEYRLPNSIPVAFSLDLKPFIEIGTSGYTGFAPDPSIGIKFILHK